MTKSNAEPSGSGKKFVCTLATLGAVLVILLVLYGAVVGGVFQDLPRQGQFGDMFGAVNALFAGGGLSVVAITLYLQSQQLVSDRESQRRGERMTVWAAQVSLASARVGLIQAEAGAVMNDAARLRLLGEINAAKRELDRLRDAMPQDEA